MACACISEMSNMLREHNACLVTTLFRQPEVVVISTAKIDTKKRGAVPAMLATFCPFCGEKYPDREPIALLGETAKAEA